MSQYNSNAYSAEGRTILYMHVLVADQCAAVQGFSEFWMLKNKDVTILVNTSRYEKFN